MPEVVQIGGVLYVLRERRGGGEFSDVFRASEATDKIPDRDAFYAIKRLRPDVDHPDFRDMRAAGIREFVHRLFTFKIGDFGLGGSWFRNENDERPELIVGDIRVAAQALVDVAVGREGAFLEPDVLAGYFGR